jgi:hypothetical protein
LYNTFLGGLHQTDGKDQSNVNDAFRAMSQSKGMQYAMHILGELPIDSLISMYSSSGGKALDAMFAIRLPPWINSGAFPKPKKTPPQMWDSTEQSGKHST